MWRLLRLIRLLRAVPDGWVHRARRRAVLDRLGRSAPPRSILMVCHGNLCRSPYAAAVLDRQLAALGAAITVDSAGFLSPKRTPPSDAIGAAAERGIDLASHRSRVVTPAMLTAADLIVVMDPRRHGRAVVARLPAAAGKVIVLGDLEPQRFTTREIVDPFGAPRDAFDYCYDRIDRCVSELTRAIFDQR